MDANHSKFWNFDKIRRWIELSHFDFLFDIICLEDDEIGLRWPVKARNIKHVTVQQCTVGGFFLDYGNKIFDEIPDYLEVIVLIRIPNVLSIMSDFMNITEEYNCGSDTTLKRLVLKNITYKFENMNAKENEMLSSGNNMITNIKEIGHRCKFNNLELMDHSVRKTKSRYFLSIQTEISSFPKLQTFNLSNTGMTDIAKLETLDLSNNFISSIDLDPTTNLWQNDRMAINLTNNTITALSSVDLELLARIPNVFVDIKNNPINCICSRQMRDVLEIIKKRQEMEGDGASSVRLH